MPEFVDKFANALDDLVSSVTHGNWTGKGYSGGDTPDASRNLWWCSLLSWGEGWHNNHHANPRAWSYREKWWEWDPGAAVVWLILRLSRGEEGESGCTRLGGAAAHTGSGGRVRRSRGAGIRPNGRSGRWGIGCGRSLAQRLGSLVMAAVLLALPARSVEAMTDIKRALSGKPPPDPIKLGQPTLSPDGRLAALGVSMDGDHFMLVIYDIDKDEMRIVDKPDDEGWFEPSFSPSGDTLAFIRFCGSCDTKGFQVSILDLQTDRTSTLTKGSDLFRKEPVFSPSGKSIVYFSGDIEWRGDQFKVGYDRVMRTLTLATGYDRAISLEGNGLKQFLFVSPGGFLDENTLIFTALGPKGYYPHANDSPLFRNLKSMVGEQDARTDWYGYRFEFGKNVEFISPDAPGRIGEIRFLSVSSDTGRMAYVDFSGRGLSESGFYGYDVFVGDGETFRNATQLDTYMKYDEIAFSKSGNRVAFLAFDRPQKNWSLWLLEVATGRVWETSLKRQLQAWHRSRDGK